jgi:lipid A 3-O-deacylase
MNIKKIALALATLAMGSSIAFAASTSSTQGINIAYGSDFITQSQPHDTSGIRVGYTIAPSNWSWANNTLVAYTEISYAYWHSTATNGGNSTENILAFGPVGRWYFANMSSWSPYVEVGVGPAALSKNSFGDRMLGSRLLFQDVGGIGATFGQNRQMYASVNAIHYSNAGLHADNDGITVPVLLTVGYNFT